INNIPSPVKKKIKENSAIGTQTEPETDATLSKEQEERPTASKTYPKIQVRPLAELLKQEILAVTQEQRQNGITAKRIQRATTIQTRRRTTSNSLLGANNGSSDFININDRLANMDKESLKYIINNGDTIYNEHLKLQARRRLRDEVRRQLKAIELDQPKDKPAKQLIEDEIVEAIKLPELLLQEIEKCFGIDISARGTQDSDSKKSSESTAAIDANESTATSRASKSTATDKESESKQFVKVSEGEQPVKESESEQPIKESESSKFVKESESGQPIKESEKCSKDKCKTPKQKKTKTMAGKKPSNAQLSEKSSLQSSKVKRIESKIKEIAKQKETAQRETDDDETNCVPIKREMQMESRSFRDNSVIVVSSSSEDEGDEEEEEDECPQVDKPADNADSDHSTASSSCSSSTESTKRRYQQKLDSDANNIVDSFEKLILPQLKESLAERYRSSHCSSLQSRLHFISCVVTSSEHNSQTFSKIEVAKMQQNLKANDNRVGIEFLLREIVNVVNLQKQAAAARRKQQLEQKDAKQQHKLEKESNGLIISASSSLMLNAEQLQSESQPHQRNCTPAESAVAVAGTAAVAAAAQSLMPPTPPRNGTPTPAAAATLSSSNRSLHSLNYLGLDASVPRLSPGSFSLTTCGLESGEPIVLVGDSVTHSLLELDRRLLENQNRRGFLEEMIMKFQREKSDLEMLSLELQSRKFLLLNTVIARNQSAATITTPTTATPPSTVTPTNSPPPPAAAAAAPEVANKPRLRQRRAIVVKRVKILSKRKRPANRIKRNPLAEAEQVAPVSNEAPEESVIPQPLQIKAEEELPVQQTEANKRATTAVVGCAIKRQRLTRSVAALAVIPPLQPPPPPPEPFAHMSFDLPRILLKSTAPPPPPTPPSATAGNMESFKYGYIPIGRLHNITSPITQIRIYKVYIIAASENGDVYMFNIANHKLERQITKHSEAITNMFLCERESFLYTTSLDGFIKKSSLENLERVVQTVYLKEPLQSIDIEWGIAFIGSRWGNIFTYNIAANKVMDMPLLSTGQSIIAVKATKEGVRKIILLGCKGNFVFLHDAATGLLLRRFAVPDGLNVYSLLLIDGHVYCGTQKNEVFRFEFASGNMTNTLSCGNGAVAMATYGEQYLLVGCYDGFIYVLNKETGRQLGRFSGPGRLVLALAIAGDKVVTSSKDNSLEILEIPSELLST
ncbi:GH18101, partial [Drosophila grimshawi]